MLWLSLRDYYVGKTGKNVLLGRAPREKSTALAGVELRLKLCTPSPVTSTSCSVYKPRGEAKSNGLARIFVFQESCQFDKVRQKP